MFFTMHCDAIVQQKTNEMHNFLK